MTCFWLLAWGWLGACQADDTCACRAGERCPQSCQGVTAAPGARSAQSMDAVQWQPPVRAARADAPDAAMAPVSDAGQADMPRMPEQRTAAAVRTEEDAGPPPCRARSEGELCNGLDDDCDHKIDEGCSCISGRSSACYTGPAGTLDVGPCRSGQQLCEQGAFRECLGATTPQPEQCNAQDDDCDGKLDEGFALESDDANCGACGHACAGAASCCGGKCVDLGSDAANCGACGAACRNGQLPGCCAGSCTDLLTDVTCGTCNNACGLLKLGGGFLCHCQRTDSGPTCVGDAVGMGLQVCR